MIQDTAKFSLNLLRVDKIALQKLAKTEGEPMSVVVRRILRSELHRCGFLPGGLMQKYSNKNNDR